MSTHWFYKSIGDPRMRYDIRDHLMYIKDIQLKEDGMHELVFHDDSRPWET